MQTIIFTITTMLISVVAFLAPLVHRLDLPQPPLLLALAFGAWLILQRGRAG